MKLERRNPEDRPYNHVIFSTDNQELTLFRSDDIIGVTVKTNGGEDAFFHFNVKDLHQLLTGTEAFVRDAAGLET